METKKGKLIMFTEEELEKLEIEATKLGMKVATYIRSKSLGKI